MQTSIHGSALSLLEQRALALVGGAVAGGAGGALFDFARAVKRWGGVRRAVAPERGLAVPPFPQVLTLALVVGMVRRPQDHNGIVDDAVSLVSPVAASETAVVGACAVAAAVAALLDGWAMEGAWALACFVGRRGQPFGRKDEADPAQRLDRVMRAAQEEPDQPLRLRDVGLDPSSPADLVPVAFVLARSQRDVQGGVREARRLGAPGEGIAPLVGALCGAENPASWRGQAPLPPDADQVVGALLAIRRA